MIRFTIPGQPITKKNSQRVIDVGPRCQACGRGRRSRPLPSEKFMAYQDMAGYYLPHKHEKLEGPFNLKAVYYMPNRRHVDLLNLQEATCDILVHYGVLADDDSRIVASHDGSRVDYDKDNPRVEVEITEAGP